ncbi:MAG: hypothetical protein MIO92_16730, partial [Methanosarcinaceae archaeon]|nr:hypothetical protein [Methanosarcinaceae archaeon]
RWKLVLFPLGVGAIAALSVLPYYTIVTKTWAWNAIVKEPISLPWIIGKFRQAIGPSNLFLSWFWLFLALFAIFVFIRTLAASSRSRSGEQKGLMLFLLVTMLVGIVSYVTFLKVLSYGINVWYYLPLMALLAVIMDKGVDAVCEKHVVGRWVRVACVAGMTALIFMSSWDAAHVRKTNIDLLAAKLGLIAAKDDFIVVTPFFLGIPFARYYRGPTEWVTLPELGDHSVHRFDLFKGRMMQNEPIRPVIERMLQTLKEGNRVWLVGSWAFLRQGEAPGYIAPAPHSPYGWDLRIYQTIWLRQAGFALQSHGKTLRRIQVPATDPVSGFENVPLLVV